MIIHKHTMCEKPPQLIGWTTRETETLSLNFTDQKLNLVTHWVVSMVPPLLLFQHQVLSPIEGERNNSLLSWFMDWQGDMRTPWLWIDPQGTITCKSIVLDDAFGWHPGWVWTLSLDLCHPNGDCNPNLSQCSHCTSEMKAWDMTQRAVAAICTCVLLAEERDCCVSLSCVTLIRAEWCGCTWFTNIRSETWVHDSQADLEVCCMAHELLMEELLLVVLSIK